MRNGGPHYVGKAKINNRRQLAALFAAARGSGEAPLGGVQKGSLDLRADSGSSEQVPWVETIISGMIFGGVIAALVGIYIVACAY